jgi:hypothetical protein
MTTDSRRQAAHAALALGLALAAATASAGTGRVNGIVSGPDGSPLAGATVSAGAASAVTNASGLYLLEGVTTGPRVIVAFAKPGYAATYGTVAVSAGGDFDDDGIADAEDRCPASDLRPIVTIDGCVTGVENRLRRGCSAEDVFVACSKRARRSWHLLGCLAERRFLQRVDFTWRTLKKSIACVHRASLPLSEAKDTPLPQTVPATLHRTLLPIGASATIPPEEGGRLESAGFSVTFPPGSIDAQEPVEAALTPLDPAGPALGAFPGDFQALDSFLAPALIETFGGLELTLSQGGQPVSLLSPATIEIPLPPNTPFDDGDRIGVWLFDRETGLWKYWFDFGAVVVAQPGGELVATDEIPQPGWWSLADSQRGMSCLCGDVTDDEGQPLAGALVTATGVGYFGVGSATSGADGAYCVNGRLGSQVVLRASVIRDGVRRDSAPVPAETPLSAGSAESGGCGTGPALTVPGN